MSTLHVPDYWTLQESLQLIRALQGKIRNFGFHLTLGGGVLNNGSSQKDLDLYFLPLDNGNEVDAAKLVAFLDDSWGKGKDMRKDRGRRMDLVSPPLREEQQRWESFRNPDGSRGIRPVQMQMQELEDDYPTIAGSPYTHKLKYLFSGMRVDVFIVGMREGEEEATTTNRIEPLFFDPATGENVPLDNPIHAFVVDGLTDATTRAMENLRRG